MNLGIKNKKIVVANWKMNPSSIKEARSIFSKCKKVMRSIANVKLVICAPSVYLLELKRLGITKRTRLGAQNIHWERSGSYTGEVSSKMVKDIKVEYCIIGHSERRSTGETNNEVNKKIRNALNEGLYPILCVGESERDEEGKYISDIKEQIETALKGVDKITVSKLLVAYEPIWAVGGSFDEVISPHSLHETAILIKKTLAGLFGRNTALSIPILYGGSVSSLNARKLVYEGKVDGLLVGRQSLVPGRFSEILIEVNKN